MSRVKSGATLQRDAWRGLARWRDLAGSEAGRPMLVYGGDETQTRTDSDLGADEQVGELEDGAEDGEAAEQPAGLRRHGLVQVDLDLFDLEFDAFDLILQA